MKSTTARRVALLVLAAPLALSACSSSSSSTPSGTSSTSATTAGLGTLTPGGQVDKAKFFDVTKAAADANKTYAFTTQVGDATSGVSSTGVVDNTNANDRKRRFTFKDDNAETEVVIAGGKSYTKTAGIAGGKWLQTPLNPEVERFLNGASGRISEDRDVVTSITYVGDEDINGTKTRHFTLALDPAKATATGSATPSSPAATTSAATTSPAATGGAAGTTTGAGVKVEYWLDDQNRTRRMTHVALGVPTMTTYDKWGEPVTITVPTDQVTSMPATAPASPAPSASAAS